MKTSHTPGPWSARALDSTSLFPYLVVGQDGHSPVARCIPTGMVVLGEVTNEQAQANARLIAAAPELLASLIAIYEMVPFDVPESDPRVTTARELILKLTQP